MSLIHSKIPAVMADISAIGKDRKNTAQGYQFRGIDDVYNELHAALAVHKVFTVPKVIEDRTEERLSNKGGTLIYRVLKIEYTFFAEDGSSITATMLGEGMDSGDKAANKAMAVAHKYALLQVFAIPTDEPKDPENDSPEPAPKTDSRQQQTRRPLSTPAQQAEQIQANAQKPETFNAMGHQFQQQGNKIADVTTPTGKTLQEVNLQIKNGGKDASGDPGPSEPLFDDAGNVNENAQEPSKQQSSATGTPMTNDQRNRAGIIVGEEYDKMKAALTGLKERGMNPKNWTGWLKLNYGVDSMQFIKRSDFSAIMEIIATDPRSIDVGIKE